MLKPTPHRLVVLLSYFMLTACGASEGTGDNSEGSIPPQNSCGDNCNLTSFVDSFTQDDGKWEKRSQKDSLIVFGHNNTAAKDGKVLELTFPATESNANASNTSPEYASEVAYHEKTFYGRYQARVKFSACNSNEELVNSIFVYASDGKDLNSNGITDNSEIDIEYLCGSPEDLWLSVWTDYDEDTEDFLKVTRRVNLTTGAIYQTPEQGEDQYDLEAFGTLTPWNSMTLSSDRFYTLGFDWQADSIRWFIQDADNKDITLWQYNNTDFIPQQPSQFMLNIWHSDTHWTDGSSAKAPVIDTHYSVDQASYSASSAMFSPEQHIIADKIINVFEYDSPELQYALAEDIGDGRGITAGRGGFTSATGDLYEVVKRYTALEPNNPLAPYLDRLEELASDESPSTTGLDGLVNAWQQAATDDTFRQVQDELISDYYYVPSLRWANILGLKKALSLLSLYDTAIQHGDGDDADSLGAIIQRTNNHLGGAPATGIDERTWLKEFLLQRRQDLLNPANNDTQSVWAESVNRVSTLEDILNTGNLSLDAPITIAPWGERYNITAE